MNTNSSDCVAVCSLLVGLFARHARRAQIRHSADTRPPTVTAENGTVVSDRASRSSLPGTAISRRARRFTFCANEMVRSGLFRGIPLYTRTTIEPYSLVFVPIGGGMMQPYERRRDGDLAGTTGSSVPSLPVDISPASAARRVPSRQPRRRRLDAARRRVRPPESNCIGRRTGVDRDRAPAQRRPQSRRCAAARVGPSPRARRASCAPNGIFVEFDNERWYSSGPPRRSTRRSLARVGELHGFPVYTDARRTARRRSTSRSPKDAMPMRRIQAEAEVTSNPASVAFAIGSGVRNPAIPMVRQLCIEH